MSTFEPSLFTFAPAPTVEYPDGIAARRSQPSALKTLLPAWRWRVYVDVGLRESPLIENREYDRDAGKGEDRNVHTSGGNSMKGRDSTWTIEIGEAVNLPRLLAATCFSLHLSRLLPVGNEPSLRKARDLWLAEDEPTAAEPRAARMQRHQQPNLIEKIRSDLDPAH